MQMVKEMERRGERASSSHVVAQVKKMGQLDGEWSNQHLNAQKQGMARQMGAGCRRNIPFYFSIDHEFWAERMVIAHPIFLD